MNDVFVITGIIAGVISTIVAVIRVKLRGPYKWRDKEMSVTFSSNDGPTVNMRDYIGKTENAPVPRNCSNCGAPVHGSQCDYCGSVF